MESGTSLSIWMRGDSTGWGCIIRGCWCPLTQTQAVDNWWGKDVWARWICIMQPFLILVYVLFCWSTWEFLISVTRCCATLPNTRHGRNAPFHLAPPTATATQSSAQPLPRKEMQFHLCYLLLTATLKSLLFITCSIYKQKTMLQKKQKADSEIDFRISSSSLSYFKKIWRVKALVIYRNVIF